MEFEEIFKTEGQYITPSLKGITLKVENNWITGDNELFIIRVFGDETIIEPAQTYGKLFNYNYERVSTKNISYDDFRERVTMDKYEEHNKTLKSNEWRYGQFVFNKLYDMHPKLADSIRGTEYDMYYKPTNEINWEYLKAFWESLH